MRKWPRRYPKKQVISEVCAEIRDREASIAIHVAAKMSGRTHGLRGVWVKRHIDMIALLRKRLKKLEAEIAK